MDRARSPLLVWRAYVPRWSFAPLSGEGASRFGGRWNPPGEPTIYASLEMSTAWAEYNQGFTQHPALIAQLAIENANLADLKDRGVLAGVAVEPGVHAIDWRNELDHGRVPATYPIRERLLREGFDGVIYPSFMSPGGACVALWRWNSDGGPILSVVDPGGRLPSSDASWR